jgi:hypothetical protein
MVAAGAGLELPPPLRGSSLTTPGRPGAAPPATDQRPSGAMPASSRSRPLLRNLVTPERSRHLFAALREGVGSVYYAVHEMPSGSGERTPRGVTLLAPIRVGETIFGATRWI